MTSYHKGGPVESYSQIVTDYRLRNHHHLDDSPGVFYHHPLLHRTEKIRQVLPLR
ncbi:MAG: hypothetical protein UW95_C0001G0007 [Parcubacteria group bacterium GW2011_GWC1_45_14]|nr:MAG: hypothetical protein UW95_C0001G0007 [Parcubacteria group bacterium GW2011_GWC1_45_14]